MDSSDLEESGQAMPLRSVSRVSKHGRTTSKGKAEEDTQLMRGNIPHIVAEVLKSMKHRDPPDTEDPQLPGIVALQYNFINVL